jgi:hypothetical protein
MSQRRVGQRGDVSDATRHDICGQEYIVFCSPALTLGKVVVGDQVVKDWLREGEGLVLRTRVAVSSGGRGVHGAGGNHLGDTVSTSCGFVKVSEDGDIDGDRVGGEDGWSTETVCTGPFQAHFVSACGALESALRAAGTCRQPPRAVDRASRWTLSGRGEVE